MKNWFYQLETAKKTVSDYDSLRTVLYEFEDGKQLEEEYNLDLNVVTRRAWKIKDHVSEKWNVELGEPRTVPEDCTTILIKEDPSQPYIWKRNTRRMIEWRIRNLSYPSDTYLVACSEENRGITVKTTNKKYFKILKLPELQRLGLTPMQKNLSFKYDKNTLVIKYIKPEALIEFDKAVLQMVKNLKPISNCFNEDPTNSDVEETPVSKKQKIIEL